MNSKLFLTLVSPPLKALAELLKHVIAPPVKGGDEHIPAGSLQRPLHGISHCLPYALYGGLQTHKSTLP